jgi:hypothetical protein
VLKHFVGSFVGTWKDGNVEDEALYDGCGIVEVVRWLVAVWRSGRGNDGVM